MHPDKLLLDIILIAAIALGCNLLLTRLRQSTVLGYILSGLIIGPFGLGWVEQQELNTLAEIGIVLLMFTLGIELSFDRINRVRAIALGGGSLQIGLTVLVGTGVALGMGWDWYRGVFLGCIVALSSSAIVLKLLQEEGELDTLHGRIGLGILLFQDLAVVPMMIVLPALAAPEGEILNPLLVAGAKAGIFLAGALLLGRSLLPRLFFQIARTRNRELFMLTVFTLCFGTAWVSGLTGLSLALGAFVAGMVVSDSEYSHQILSDVLPFKDLFLALFFISMGMLLNVGFVFDHPEILALIVLFVLLVNFLICTLIVLLFKYPLRVAVFVGAALSQIGEFSFVLANMGKTTGLIGDYLYQLTLVGTILTMALTPQMTRLGKRLPGWLIRWGVPERFVFGKADGALDAHALAGHVIVCGYGPVGEHVTQVLREHSIPYLVLELNASRIRALREQGIQAYYGDSGSHEVLHRAGLERAKAVVVTYADPHAARKTVALVKSLHPEVRVVTRTRLPEDIAELRRLGADAVVEEEFEMSLEMAAWTLNALGISRVALETEQAAIREDDYRLFTDPRADLEPLHQLMQHLPDVDIATCRVHPESPLAGKTLAEAKLRSTLGVTVFSILNSRNEWIHPSASDRIEAGDLLTVIGEKTRLAEVRTLVEHRPSAGE